MAGEGPRQDLLLLLLRRGEGQQGLGRMEIQAVRCSQHVSPVLFITCFPRGVAWLLPSMFVCSLPEKGVPCC